MNRSILLMFALLVLTLPLAPALRAESTADQNKAVARQFYEEVFNAGKIELVDKYVAADAIEHQIAPGLTDPQPGRASLTEFLAVFRNAFPDLKVTVDDMMAEGDRVVARCTMTGTHQGEFMGMPATGNTVSIQMVDIIRFQDGKCVEHWGVSDDAGMMQQLESSTAMTTDIIFHEVQDGAVWAKAWKMGPGSRHELFGEIGIKCRNFRDPNNPNATGIMAEIPDMVRFQELLQSEEGQKAMQEDGLEVDTMRMLVEFTP